MSRKTVFKDTQKCYSVSEENGTLILEVLCGRSGMYVEEHVLTEKERNRFLENPSTISDLADFIYKRSLKR